MDSDSTTFLLGEKSRLCFKRRYGGQCRLVRHSGSGGAAATHQALREALLGSPPEDGLQGGGGRGLEDTDELIRESDLAFEVPPPFRIPLSPGNRACRAVA